MAIADGDSAEPGWSASLCDERERVACRNESAHLDGYRKSDVVAGPLLLLGGSDHIGVAGHSTAAVRHSLGTLSRGRGARQRAGGRLDPVEKIGTIGLMASSGVADSESQWAEQEARRLLEPLGARWRHTLGVVERAREVAKVLSASDAEALVAAAYLHDVGYAPELAKSGFHALDGGRFVRAHGHERLAGLVAHHCSAEAEAGERGLRDELAEFVDERSTLSQALTYCDLTTDSEGQWVELMERLRGIRERYGPETPEARALERATPALLDDVRMAESMLAEAGAAIEAGDRGRRR